jgi:16S rRNA A1518/A1519 N6-dimethyltransferase RsmA/KsgA/DIM1 with predicted DNA glycosylase/AP lyase activity
MADGFLYATKGVVDFMNRILLDIESYQAANDILYQQFGIKNFFLSVDELNFIRDSLNGTNKLTQRENKAEYGDFQTNANLADRVAVIVSKKNVHPDIIIEPTCGTGNFIIASLKIFKDAKVVFGIEIYKQYTWECKFNIIDYYLNNPQDIKSDIHIIHADVFDYKFDSISKEYRNDDILIIGNPPWVTNSMLGELESSNIPRKSNFKNQNGIEAITGKGNFDIAEYITTSLIKTFQDSKTTMALLVKNAVIKNIVYEQNRAHYSMSSIEQYRIDSKKEFQVSVEASLFYAQLQSKSQYFCTELDLYTNSLCSCKQFGWVDQKFVSDINNYAATSDVDGECQFVWRQGMKHDCSSIMELERDDNDIYKNALNEVFPLEKELVYGLLKSSDIKSQIIDKPRKYTIVTQQTIGQDTCYIKQEYPMIYKYLYGHLAFFKNRKSSIYNNKPLFSIFGIGNYSFAPYKIGISGLYKQLNFALIMPDNGKPIMLDDTCYFIGFNRIDYAIFTLILLTSDKSHTFLQSITFSDAKRPFTKDILMRIDIYKIAISYPKSYIIKRLTELSNCYELDVTMNTWNDFLNELLPKVNQQMKLKFA